VHLRVAGFTIRVSSADRDLPLAPAPASSSFLVGPAPASDNDVVDVAVEAGDCRAERTGLRLFDSGGSWRLYRQADGYRFDFVTQRSPAPYKVAFFNPDFSIGRVTLDRTFFAGATTIDPLEYPLDELLVISLLGRGRGVELHGCGVADGDDGYLFVGQSGAGKTTTARLWLDDGAALVLSDDRIVVREDGDGLWMYGTPWHGEEEFASPASAPLTRIFFLAHGPGNALRPATGAAAAARLFTCCFPPFHDHAGLDFTLSLLGRILDRVPCFELTFVPDPGVVGFVRGRA
jgi:hypothetical protein